ncbi:MaoC/PaaZ C-terminal domain-containing protein [Pilimelia columellifera]|uniref:MaoC/PaaZ C-terminal domain-containing protein n=1 Tax=Pilimelia columellifera subsp. columellifera TaxID=706583 RepID=A0ABN3N1G2_9ACTN
MIIELDEMPALGSIYRRAVTRALPLPVGRGGLGWGAGERDRPDKLPDTILSLGGVAVDRARLAAYDRVCGFGLTDHLPATYPHVLAFPLAMRLMSDDDFPMPMIGLVHLGNRIDVLRPVDAAEPLELRVWADGLRPHDRGRQFDVHAEALVSGEPVWRGRSTYLRRERSRPPTGGVPEATPHREAGGAGGDPQPPRPPTPSAQWRLTPRIGVDYADVSGDRNPIHTSLVGARLFGFARPIAHGMWTAARSLSALGAGRLPDRFRYDVTFTAPVLLPGAAAFVAETAGDGWRLVVFDPATGRPYLRGAVTTPSEAR